MRTFYPLFAILIVGLGLLLRAQDGQNLRSTASVRGKIVFEGTIPARPLVRMGGDPYCTALGQLPQEQLDDVIVYAQPISQTSLPVPATSIVLDRRNCGFVPHTLTLQVGQKLAIRNNDGTAHNVHIWSSANMPINVALPLRGSEVLQIFQKEEFPIPIRCDIHNWEYANVGVFSHPYHTVSKLNGAYEFTLPSGTYEIGAWHEKLGKHTQSFVVRAGEDREISFVFK